MALERLSGFVPNISGSNLGKYLFLFFFLILFVLSLAIIMNYLRYRKIKVVIFSERVGNNPDPGSDLKPYREEDKAVLKKGKDVWYLWLKKNKTYIAYPPSYAVVPTKGGVVVYLKKLGPEEFYPIPIKISNEGDLDVKIGEGKKLFASMVWRKMRDTFEQKSLIPKEYIPLIGVLVVVVFIIVMAAMLVKKFDVLASVAANLNEAAQVMKGCSGGSIPPGVG